MMSRRQEKNFRIFSIATFHRNFASCGKAKKIFVVAHDLLLRLEHRWKWWNFIMNVSLVQTLFICSSCHGCCSQLTFTAFVMNSLFTSHTRGRLLPRTTILYFKAQIFLLISRDSGEIFIFLNFHFGLWFTNHKWRFSQRQKVSVQINGLILATDHCECFKVFFFT